MRISRNHTGKISVLSVLLRDTKTRVGTIVGNIEIKEIAKQSIQVTHLIIYLSMEKNFENCEDANDVVKWRIPRFPYYGDSSSNKHMAIALSWETKILNAGNN